MTKSMKFAVAALAVAVGLMVFADSADAGGRRKCKSRRSKKCCVTVCCKTHSSCCAPSHCAAPSCCAPACAAPCGACAAPCAACGDTATPPHGEPPVDNLDPPAEPAGGGEPPAEPAQPAA